MWRSLGAGIALYAAVTAPAHASILSGSVSFDHVTDLFTYSYTIDNTNGLASIRDLNIIVDTSILDGFFPEDFSHSEPDGWRLGRAGVGDRTLSPTIEFGMVWGWSTNSTDGLLVEIGEVLPGFSFTVPYAPTPLTTNNYYLYAPGFTGGPTPINPGIVEFGRIVAPNFRSADMALDVPVPATLLLLASGLVGFGIVRRM